MSLFKASFPQLMREKSSSHLYFVDGHRRRRVVFPEVANEVREAYPKIKLREVADEEIQKYEPGALVPRNWGDEHWIEPPQNKQQMREIIVSRLRGEGVEFGAGSRPLPLPLATSVEYAEPFQSEKQYERMNYTDNTVRPTLINPIENQHQIAMDSLDFMVAAHVIEHTPNPIGAIVETFHRLKDGGDMVLVVPDKRRTFDKHRDNTSLKHLIADYESPDRERDLENYVDFFKNAKFRNAELSDKAMETAKKAHADGIDVHYHVWTPASFFGMMRHIQENYAPFSSFEIKPPVDDENCLEFYVVARK